MPNLTCKLFTGRNLLVKNAWERYCYQGPSLTSQHIHAIKKKKKYFSAPVCIMINWQNLLPQANLQNKHLTTCIQHLHSLTTILFKKHKVLLIWNICNVNYYHSSVKAFKSSEKGEAKLSAHLNEDFIIEFPAVRNLHAFGTTSPMFAFLLLCLFPMLHLRQKYLIKLWWGERRTWFSMKQKRFKLVTKSAFSISSRTGIAERRDLQLHSEK